MKLFVLKPIKLKKAGRLFDITPGAIVEIKDPRKAHTLIESGHIKPSDETGKVHAARIYSKILCEEVWVVTSPEAISYIPNDEIYYLPEEIRNLKGATPEEIRQIHMIKKEIGGCLVSAKESKGHA
ncbi:MAG TPA: hypothetical protein DD641_00815 [Deltaproteobacteria bacterium]|nr:hypothetical protein [Deltaproteobacteria bacterium]